MRCSICGADTYPDEVCPECSLTAQVTRALHQHRLDRAEIERLEKLKLEAQVELLRWMPVIEAAKEWRRDIDLHTLDSNCQAGDHDDCPSRLSEPRLVAAIDTALVEKESDRDRG